ncbi:hypothetical protein ACYZTX_15090 [Pseudomonas sp. MDT1-17]
MAALYVHCPPVSSCLIRVHFCHIVEQTHNLRHGHIAWAMPSQTQRSYRIVVPSKVSADNVLEAYKAGNGGKVFIYEWHLLASNLVPSSFERAAQECI